MMTLRSIRFHSNYLFLTLWCHWLHLPNSILFRRSLLKQYILIFHGPLSREFILSPSVSLSNTIQRRIHAGFVDGGEGRIQDFWKGGGSISGADTGFPEGGVKTFTSPPPLGHCPRDVIHPPENWKTPPLLDIHKHPPPPLGHCPCDVIHIPRGGGVIGPGHAHFA